MTNLDHIAELRAELASCFLTRRERAQIVGELKSALATQAELERTQAATFNDVFDEAPSA